MVFGIDLPEWLDWLHWVLRAKNALVIAIVVGVVVSAWRRERSAS